MTQMKILRIGDCYFNISNITHIQFETSPQGLMAVVFLNCQITDRNGCNGIQATKTLTAAGAKELRLWLDQNLEGAQPDSL